MDNFWLWLALCQLASHGVKGPASPQAAYPSVPHPPCHRWTLFSASTLTKPLTAAISHLYEKSTSSLGSHSCIHPIDSPTENLMKMKADHRLPLSNPKPPGVPLFEKNPYSSSGPPIPWDICRSSLSGIAWTELAVSSEPKSQSTWVRAHQSPLCYLIPCSLPHGLLPSLDVISMKAGWLLECSCISCLPPSPL